MKYDKLCHEFEKYIGQPVKIYTDDGKVHCGVDLAAFEDAVRIIDKCGRTELITYAHIDTVVEPQMELTRCCRDRCDCRYGNGNGNGSGSGNVSGDFDNGDSYYGSDCKDCD